MYSNTHNMFFSIQGKWQKVVLTVLISGCRIVILLSPAVHSVHTYTNSETE